ncbi:DUF2975 domain-containing protein [Sphingomonas sp. SM33]|uniref:DUF2975 domain-containing protein n=1 Tax=Sphingomonas telluris TaxID=2907998 RepID=A0ABS9VN08_9SPHN|nr:DUF2975 domain-containing protein [Sphingomonas telluris]MCH8616357.1 DUF2975 domain-containing protein [Sphingomonas telluris]
MAHASIARTAFRLKLGVWIVWACILLVYVAGRFGLGVGLLRVQSHATAGDTPSIMAVADVTMVLLTIALWQLSRMLGAIAAGDLFSARVVGAFRSFALWLLIVALVWIAIPIALTLLAGPGSEHHLEFKLQLRDLMTIGITLILFLVARLLERARTIDEEMREIV